MTQIYNPQWNRSMPVDTPLFRKMVDNYFSTRHTGGGYFAWQRETEDGYVLITCDGGVGLGVWDERNEPLWIVGRYKDSDFICVTCVTLTQALKVAKTLREPAQGEGSTINFTDYKGD